jgi:hypothetical protein
MKMLAAEGLPIAPEDPTLWGGCGYRTNVVRFRSLPLGLAKC